MIKAISGGQTGADLAVEYRDVPSIRGYADPLGDYQVGDDGTIWSSLACGGPRVCNGIRYKRLKGTLRPDGYRAVALTVKGVHVIFLVHHIVLETFVGPRPDGWHSCHTNGIRDDNRLANLRYDTVSGNFKDKIAHGTLHKGEQIVQSKITELDVHRIRRLDDYGVPKNIIADVFGLCRAQVGRIIDGTRWAWLKESDPDGQLDVG
jgi:HNH endonuclease